MGDEAGDSAIVTDERWDWIQNYACRTLGLKADKWQKMLGNDDYKTITDEFINKKDNLALIVQLEAGGALKPCASFPDSAKTKAVYFVKRENIEVPKKNIQDLIMFGDISAMPVDQLGNVVDEILSNVLLNEANFESWPQVVSQDVHNHIHSLKSDVFATNGSLRGHERVDTDPNALAIRDDGDDKKTPVDRALMHSMQNAVIEWARQIRDVVQQDSAQPLVDGKNPTPIVELKFWESREKNMFNIYSQLKCDKVRKMATVLKVIDSTYYSTVWNLFQEVIAQLRKAQDITAHLKPMTNVLDELESKDFAEHVESDCVTLKCVLEIVGLCWARCKSYQDPLRIVVLLQEICNLLIELARSYLDPENLLKGEIDESLEKLNNCKKVMKTYSDLYTETQNRMKDFFEEGDTPVEWTFARTLVFSRFDNFMKRIDQVRDFFETSLEYLKLEKIEFGGISGGALSQRVVTLFDEFNAEFKVFTERTYDPLDWNDQTGFKVDYYKFRSKIDDFDRRLAKCACLGFDDCCNVESMYKLLAIFGSLVKRPLIACDFDANYEIMLKTYKAL